METTKKLYVENAYLTEFCARVLACEPLAGGRFAVALDRTLFYPEGGGQPADHGALGPTCVLDAHERDGVVWHETASPLRVGETVQGNVDWQRRFDHMQQHTGEHILSGIAHSQYGCDNVGFHIGPDATRVDLSLPLSQKELDELEQAANWVVWQNVPVCASFPPPEELAGLAYRSKKELDGPVRIISVEHADVCACCGTHVARSGQVGMIKIASADHYKGGMRLTVLCGARAARDYCRKSRDVHTLSVMLSAKPDALPQAAARLLEGNEALAARRAAAENRLAQLLAAQCAGQTAPLLFEEALTADGARRLATLLCQQGAAVAGVFFGGPDSWNYAVAGAGRDAAALVKGLHAALGGKGGGKPVLCQGTVPAPRKEIERWWRSGV